MKRLTDWKARRPCMSHRRLRWKSFTPIISARCNKQNYKYVLVVVDAFTRFVWLEATKTTSSKETIRNLQRIFKTFGNPSEIVTDRGTAFTSGEFADFVLSVQTKHRKVAVAAPWANGMAERVNRFLKNSMLKSLDMTEEWDVHLGKIQYVLNNTYHAAVKSSPSQLMLGYHQRAHEDFELSQLTRALANTESEINRETLRNTARLASDSIRNYNKDYKDKLSKTPSVYREGDYVLVRDLRVKLGESSKLKPRYKGPYQIKKNLGNNRYVVTDIPGFNLGTRPLDTILSCDKLKPWIKPIG